MKSVEILIPEVLFQRLEEIGKREDRSRANLIRYWLTREANEYERLHAEQPLTDLIDRAKLEEAGICRTPKPATPARRHEPWPPPPFTPMPIIDVPSPQRPQGAPDFHCDNLKLDV